VKHHGQDDRPADQAADGISQKGAHQVRPEDVQGEHREQRQGGLYKEKPLGQGQWARVAAGGGRWRVHVCFYHADHQYSDRHVGIWETVATAWIQLFPAQPGDKTVSGIPTGVSAPPLAKKLLAGSDAAVVWASRNGEAVGHRVSPLHRKAPEAAQKNPRLYDLLTLLDAIRIGGAREREVASREIRARLT
jgi:hypothetical protein